MQAPAADTLFAGSIPELCDTLLVPMIFASYADDLAQRVAALRPDRGQDPGPSSVRGAEGVGACR